MSQQDTLALQQITSFGFTISHNGRVIAYTLYVIPVPQSFRVFRAMKSFKIWRKSLLLRVSFSTTN